MKRFVVQKNVVLTILSGAVLCFLLAACKNFLNAGKVKEEIEYAIYVNNHECPVATVEEPVFSDGGVAKNKAIIVSFTMAMDRSSFMDNYRIEDSAGTSLLDYYMEPQWSDDDKVVTIAANERNLIDMRGKKTMDVYFMLSKGCKTHDELPIQNAINHKYRINDTVDNTPPTLSVSSYVLRPSISYLNYVVAPEAKLMEGIITAQNEAQICAKNHINSELYIYIEGSDYGGGPVNGHVVCTRICDTLGNALTNDQKKASEKSYTITNLYNNGDEYSTTWNFKLSSTQGFQDGLYEIKVYVNDGISDSENCKVYYIIRDTTLAYSITARIVNDTPLWYQKNEYDGDERYKQRSIIFDSQTPTKTKLENARKLILFDEINDDVFYTSTITNNKYYADSMEDLSYYLSWGLKFDDMTTPVKVEGRYYDNDNNIEECEKARVYFLKHYDLPAAFNQFLNDNEDKDVILTTFMIDSVGNQNTAYSVWPKKFDSYYYTVSNDGTEVELNFSDLELADVGDKSPVTKYRLFYGQIDGVYNEETDYSNIPLTRYDPDKGDDNDEHDNTITGLTKDKYYLVYIQSVYDLWSNMNGDYCGCTFGPLLEMVVHTDPNASGGSLAEPKFTIDNTKIRGEVNSGLFDLNISVGVDGYSYNPSLKYIPYYCYEYSSATYDNENTTYNLGNPKWIKLESHQGQQTFNVTVKNPLRAPLREGEAWDCDEWDFTVLNSGDQDGPDNSYFQAVRNCKSLGYPDTKAYIKLVAADGTNFKESKIKEVSFSRDDDNIAPKVSSDITLHDSHLTFDGHSFEFSELVREDEGNLTEYFKYYYTPYNPAWGDNLNVLSEDEIKMLPGGVSPYTGTTWLDNGACYRIDINIPVYGLADGEYMYFAKLEDSYGNYKYVTLGKAHIGTFKNKLKVELDGEKEYFISKLELAPEEQYFDRNMINVQSLGKDANGNWDWNPFYGWLNELQNCVTKTEDGKTILYSHLGESGDPNKYVYRYNKDLTNGVYGFEAFNEPVKDYNGETSSPLGSDAAENQRRIIDKGWWYRITMQSFNEDKLIKDNQGNYINGSGVNKMYGLPYHYSPSSYVYLPEGRVIDNNTYYLLNPGDEHLTQEDPEPENIYNWDVWNHAYDYNLRGQQKYDVCTEETVSNSVYYYVPWSDQNGSENFSDYYAYFMPDTATPKSNHNYIVNVLASNRDLGSDPDEWERRGKLIVTHEYNPTAQDYNTFNKSVADIDIINSREKGLIYYAVVAHFALGESAVSNVFTMQGF